MAIPGHWQRWHRSYDEPGSALARRLGVVRARLAGALDQAAAGPIQLISMCAGQGRDVIGVLESHRRRADVSATLVELDPMLAQEARESARRVGLATIEIIEADAADTSVYARAVPASVILVCGVFGNIIAADIRATIAELPHLCAPSATVIWTRHRRPPDLTPAIRRWFLEERFAELSFDTEPDVSFGVGTARFMGQPQPLRPGRTLFRFVGGGDESWPEEPGP